MELEKKKFRFAKKKIIGPIITYHSVAMPLIEVISDVPAENLTPTTEE